MASKAVPDVGPDLTEAGALFTGLRWPETVGMNVPLAREIWAQTRLVVWSPAALAQGACVLHDCAPGLGAEAAHFAEQVDGAAYPLDVTWLGALPTPECWFVPGGIVGVRVTVDGVRRETTLQAVALSASPSGLSLTALVNGEPWLGGHWPYGLSRADVLAYWQAAPGFAADLLAMVAVTVQAGLLARLGGLVETVEVQAGDVSARWTCLARELPTRDPRVKPS